MSDANAVSIITERVSERESRLWTSTIGNVVVYRQVNVCVCVCVHVRGCACVCVCGGGYITHVG